MLYIHYNIYICIVSGAKPFAVKWLPPAAEERPWAPCCHRLWALRAGADPGWAGTN